MVPAPAVDVATGPHSAGVVVPSVERDRLEADREPCDHPGPLVVAAGRWPAELALVVEPPARDATGIGDGAAEGVPHGHHLGLPDGGQVDRVVDFVASAVEVEVRGDGRGVEGVGPTEELVVPGEAVLVGVEVQPIATEAPCVEHPQVVADPYLRGQPGPSVVVHGDRGPLRLVVEGALGPPCAVLPGGDHQRPGVVRDDVGLEAPVQGKVDVAARQAGVLDGPGRRRGAGGRGRVAVDEHHGAGRVREGDVQVPLEVGVDRDAPFCGA